MSTKSQIAKSIVDEVIAAQSRPLEKPRRSPIPPVLWVGDGRAINASYRAYDLIHEYAGLLIIEQGRLTAFVSEDEISNAVGHAVANLLVDVAVSSLRVRPSDELVTEIDDRTINYLSKRRSSLSYYFGCSFLKGIDVPSVSVGPVIIERRDRWLVRERDEGRLSRISARRIFAKWEGLRVRRRSNQLESGNERAILDAIGNALFVCSVSTGNLSIKSAAPKALLAARISLLSVALLWELPSRVLREMRLSHDGLRLRRQYAMSNGAGFYGSSSSTEGAFHGYFVDKAWLDDWGRFRPYCEPIAEALNLFVDPEKASRRPKLLRRLFMALWWFHEACREQSDLIAITKFASSMDALALGRRAEGIKNFISLRVGRATDEAWLKDGRSPADLVHEIYELTRNQVLHGSILDFDKDWSSLRSSAEFVARQCLVALLNWMKFNPDETDPRKLLSS